MRWDLNSRFANPDSMASLDYALSFSLIRHQSDRTWSSHPLGTHCVAQLLVPSIASAVESVLVAVIVLGSELVDDSQAVEVAAA